MTKFKNETRGGLPFTLYTTEAGGDRPIHGRIVVDGCVRIASWLQNGCWREGGKADAFDLLPLREPSEAAVEAARKAAGMGPMWEREMTAALTAAYKIDFPEGGK